MSAPVVPPCLYAVDAPGLAARVAALADWGGQYGRIGCVPRSHGWHPDFDAAGWPRTPRCQPAVLAADARGGLDLGPDLAEPRCACTAMIGALVYRAACQGCDWEGLPRTEGTARWCERQAAEDGLDHAWPGWRDLPVMPAPPTVDKRRPEWRRQLAEHYPAGWVEAGGPVRVAVTGRHLAGAVPVTRGWLVAAGRDAA